MHDSGLYIQKILTKREMINCQKFNFLLFLTIHSVTTAVRELNGTSQISLVTHDAKGENALDSAVVELQEMFSLHGSLLTDAMYHHGETL